ncbi:MAG: branched-chain amino acid ABC transporter permease [Betaproteobacteria bacterium]|nr:branched-chain amino acid ABC transporter permease [Betaproteobacteria bacterium]MDE1955013.1 branched-chain amino acid ABC transporter permease [Betaproteobacteria bacterium]MDE2151117.1 branched-chain amino acid ABC transporter permease [Betaproteobacteria bacterium]MDE2477650.1 branched-chain amino acid ABC transporter permease [Betaproteobacteria bacterium]
MEFLNQIIQGVLLGGYYAILASGLSFLFGVMRIVNLAHGSLVVLAGYLIFSACKHLGVDVPVAVLMVMPVMALLGWALNRLLLQRSLRGGMLVPILATFGLSIVVDNLLFQSFGADTRSLAPNIGSLSYDSWQIVGDLYVSKLDVMTFGTAVAVLGALQLVLSRTGIGRAIRATAEDPDAVNLIGIDSRMVYSAASAIALLLITVAALFLGMRSTFAPYAGQAQLLFAFETVVIGGTGSLWGTLLGGIVLGVSQSIGAQINPIGFLIAGHVVFLAILVLRVYSKVWHLRRPRLRAARASTQGAGA